MRFFTLLVIVLWITADRAPAKDATSLVKLASADDARRWEAVGRVNLQGTGFCTGALIAPDLVLTAAHCLYNKKTGKRVETAKIEFLAGWRNGRAAAGRKAKRVAIHQNYNYSDNRQMDRVASDIALIELDHPIRNSRIVPFEWAPRPRVGQEVQVVSYAKERAEAPSLQETCSVLGRDAHVLVLSCQVNFGASGSPIFVLQNGVPYIASVVSAKAEWRNQRVALGTSLGAPLRELMARLEDTDGVFQKVQQTSSGLNNLTGAGKVKSKFLKP